MPQPLKLDEEDFMVLQELDVDARKPVAEIAEDLGLKRTTLGYTLKKFEKIGLISSYTILVDYYRLGWKILDLYIDLMEHSIERIQELIHYFKDTASCVELTRSFGKYDLVVRFVAKDLGQIYSLLKQLRVKFKDVIRNYDVFLPLEQFYSSRDYLSSKNAKNIIWESSFGETADYDEVDEKIILLLKENARENLGELAHKLGMTSSSLIYRLNMLKKKKILLAFRALIDLEVLDYESYRVFLDFEDGSHIDKVKSFLKTNPNVVYVSQGIGPFDLIFDVEVKDSQDLFAILSSLKKTYDRVLRDYKYLKFLRRLK